MDNDDLRSKYHDHELEYAEQPKKPKLFCLGDDVEKMNSFSGKREAYIPLK